MIFTGLCIFAVIVLWRYGLIGLMFTSDRTYISSVIAALYIVTCCHCFWRTRSVAREGETARRCRKILAVSDGPDMNINAAAMPAGIVTDHIRSLVMKAKVQGAGRVDQTLLLRSLADRLRGSNGFGAFA